MGLAPVVRSAVVPLEQVGGPLVDRGVGSTGQDAIALDRHRPAEPEGRGPGADALGHQAPGAGASVVALEDVERARQARVRSAEDERVSVQVHGEAELLVVAGGGHQLGDLSPRTRAPVVALEHVGRTTAAVVGSSHHERVSVQGDVESEVVAPVGIAPGDLDLLDPGDSVVLQHVDPVVDQEPTGARHGPVPVHVERLPEGGRSLRVRGEDLVDQGEGTLLRGGRQRQQEHPGDDDRPRAHDNLPCGSGHHARALQRSPGGTDRFRNPIAATSMRDPETSRPARGKTLSCQGQMVNAIAWVRFAPPGLGGSRYQNWPSTVVPGIVLAGFEVVTDCAWAFQSSWYPPLH